MVVICLFKQRAEDNLKVRITVTTSFSAKRETWPLISAISQLQNERRM